METGVRQVPADVATQANEGSVEDFFARTSAISLRKRSMGRCYETENGTLDPLQVPRPGFGQETRFMNPGLFDPKASTYRWKNVEGFQRRRR